MKGFCQNPLCENPRAKVVPVSVENPSDEKRTLCVTCEEAYSWGVQHGTRTARAKAGSSLSGVGLPVNRRELATILAALRNYADENLQETKRVPDQVARRIATGGGHFKSLDFEEVGRLCERLQLAQHAPAGPGGRRRSRRRKRP